MDGMPTLPYGTWPSPLSAAALAAGAVTPGNLLATGDRLTWVEARPAENGRQALVTWAGGDVVDLGPADFNARTRVHEYGGAPFAVRGDRVVSADFTDQRLYDVTTGAVPLTPEPDTPAAVRYADARWLDADTLVAVRERHQAGAVHNEVVRLDLTDGSATVLAGGRDFVAAPRPSEDGSRLAWLAWDHPDMPWDAAELWAADLGTDGLANPARIAGGPEVSVCSPLWLADGSLVFSEDASGFWEVHRWVPGEAVPTRISGFDADVGDPAWMFGSQTIASLPDGRLACLVREKATSWLALLDPADGSTTRVDLMWSHLSDIGPYGDGVAFIAAEPTGRRSVATWSPGAGPTEVRGYDIPGMAEADRAVPQPIEVPTPDGATTHGFFHPPAHASVTGPDDERPPLVVFTHGGPTGNVGGVLSPGIAFWTTRGFAVVDVNYRGSTGYGRAYRDQLKGAWGELDVADTIAVARGLAAQGLVDGDRMAIRGGSAGGYTTLAVLTTPDHPFACGTSFFGVADLKLLAEHTHKFEARYLDQLVGPLPEAEERYRERSPLHRAELLSRPLLVLQGLEDKVVPPEQSEAMVAAAAANGIPHAYIAFEGEQHGFRRSENIVTWLESELSFYGEVMGFVPAGSPQRVELVR